MRRIDVREQTTHLPDAAFKALPRRIFIDSCTVQTLRKYSEFIYDGGSLSEYQKIKSTTKAIQNVVALRNICQVTNRANFQWIVSEGSRKEAQAKKDLAHLGWYYEIEHYALVFFDETAATPKSIVLSKRLNEDQFGYLGSGDRALLRDAVFFQCDSFLTMERKLPMNAAHIAREIGLQIITPVSYWEQLRPWAALW